MNRALSVRSKNQDGEKSSPKHRFTMASLRGATQPDLSKKLYKLIKSESHAIESYEQAGRERAAIASQLSEWGEETQDDSVSDISDKIGVLMAEIAEQEDNFAHNLEEARVALKSIRNVERSVQPTRDHRAKIADDIAKLKHKDPTTTRIPELEQELVRAEAQSLVADAQLVNITRQKFKEAYDLHFAATIERAEKQILLAQQARKLLNLIDDTPVVPGDAPVPYAHDEAAKQVLGDAEEALRAWEPRLEPVHSSAAAGESSTTAATATTTTAAAPSAEKELA